MRMELQFSHGMMVHQIHGAVFPLNATYKMPIHAMPLSCVFWGFGSILEVWGLGHGIMSLACSPKIHIAELQPVPSFP